MLECKKVHALQYHEKGIKLDPFFCDSDLDFNIVVTLHDPGLTAGMMIKMQRIFMRVSLEIYHGTKIILENLSVSLNLNTM